jgi:hypothetical protein
MAVKLARLFGEDGVPVGEAIDTVFFDCANHHSKELFVGRLLRGSENSFHN